MNICRSCSCSVSISVTTRVVSYTDGNHLRLTLKMMMNIRPVKKVGTEKPTIIRKVPTWSKMEYCL